VACGLSRSHAQSLKWDTSWTPEDTFLSISINVQHAISIEQEDGELRKSLAEKLKTQTGMELSQLEQLQMIFHGKLNAEEAVGPGIDNLHVMKFRFSQPQKMEELILSFAAGELKIVEHQGQKYYKPAFSFSPSFFSPDPQTLFLGGEPGIQSIMDNEDSMSELRDRIQAADANDTDMFIAFVQNETTKQILQEITKAVDGLPFNLADIAGEARHGHVIVSLSNGKPIQAAIVAKDAEGAQRLQGAVDALVGLGKFGLPAARKELKEQELPDFGDAKLQEFMRKNQEIGLKLLSVAETVLEGTVTSTDENLLEVKVVAMGGIGQIVTLFGEQMQAVFEMSGEFEREQGKIVEEFSETGVEVFDGIEPPRVLKEVEEDQ
jgi:hypothetical protein